MGLSVEEKCQQWAREYVIGMNLCPFAKGSLDRGAIKWMVVKDLSVVDQLIEDFVHIEKESVFFILESKSDFLEYLDVVQLVEDVIATLGYLNNLKIVTFHPDHQYEGTAYDDTLNFGNRSPFPMIQLLREEQLSHISMTEEWKEEILSRNSEVLKEKGKDELNKMLDECRG